MLDYVATRCFGKPVALEAQTMRSHLSRPELQEGIAKYLARIIAELTIERRTLEFERADFRLSETSPFSWRRNLPPPVEAKKTIFNYVATYNDFERRFCEFMDKAEDVQRFASLGTTEQGESGTQFRVDYLKPSGAIGFIGMSFGWGWPLSLAVGVGGCSDRIHHCRFGINERVKHREPFRPFAPAVLEERVAEFRNRPKRPVHDDGTESESR